MFLPETGVTGRIPLSIRIIGKPGYTGAIIVGLIALFYVAVLPLVDSMLRGPEIEASRVIAADRVSVVPPEGWAYDDESEDFHVFTQAGATLIVSPAVTTSTSLEDAIAPTQRQLAGDAQGQWVISEPQYFETSVGDSAVLLAAQNPTDAQLVWVVQHNDQQVSVVMTAPAPSLEQVFGSAQALVQSMLVLPPVPS